MESYIVSTTLLCSSFRMNKCCSTTIMLSSYLNVFVKKYLMFRNIRVIKLYWSCCRLLQSFYIWARFFGIWHFKLQWIVKLTHRKNTHEIKAPTSKKSQWEQKMRMKIMKLGRVGLFAYLEGIESFIYFSFLELRVFVSVTENTVSSCSLNVTHEVYFPAQKKISFVLNILCRLSAKEEK